MLWTLLARLALPRHAVTAGPLHPLGGHESWNPRPWH